MSVELTAEQKLEILVAIINEVASTDASYPDGDIAADILKKYHEQTGNKLITGNNLLSSSDMI